MKRARDSGTLSNQVRSTRYPLMSKEERTSFTVAIRKAKNVQEIHAAFGLLPEPPSGSTTGPPTTSENM